MSKQFLFIKIWKYKVPALWAATSVAAVLLWPAIPLRGLVVWAEFWFYWFPQNILYVVLSIATGVYVGIYVYNKKVAPTCPSGTSKTGIFGSVGGILLGACPACIPILAFALPLSATLFLGFYSWIFLILGAIVLLFSIYKMNGFKKI